MVDSLAQADGRALVETTLMAGQQGDSAGPTVSTDASEIATDSSWLS